MSWVRITDVAKKAENILNKIDKNAATALTMPPSVGGSLDTMKKGLSNSTQSLKASLSPARSKQSAGSGSSAKSENVLSMSRSDSVESKEQFDSIMRAAELPTSSRRTSVSSKADESMIIDMTGVSTSLAEKPFATEQAQLSSTSKSDSQELAAFKIALSEVSSERDELRLRLNALNRDIENAGLKQRAQELELLAVRLTEERDHAQLELQQTRTASNAYVHSISELEGNLAKLQQEFIEVEQKWRMQLKETEHGRQELKEYRTKAQRALQMKDQLIAELKGNGNSVADTTTTHDRDIDRVLQMEYDGLKQEHQNTVEENRSLLLQLEEIRRDLLNLQKQHGDQLNTLRENEEVWRKELRTERERLLNSESELRVTAKEVETLRQQLSNQMAASSTRLQQKEQELEQLRRKANNEYGGMSVNETEMRIKALTQALVEKQSTVENITADRNALRIQLEKSEGQVQQLIYNNTHNAPRNAILSNTTDDVKAQFPSLMRENPFDNRVARRVKQAYSSLDSAGIRLGAFLRRYPLMRIFVLMYVALLHIWVMFVLVAYSP